MGCFLVEVLKTDFLPNQLGISKMKYTLITGASRGIGEAMAGYCAYKGFNLILVARSKEKLDELAYQLSEKYRIHVMTYVADLSITESTTEIYEWCRANNFYVDKLINNAGVGLYGKFEELSLDDQLNVIYVNQLSMVNMTHKFIPMLKENDQSYIMNVASTACYQPIPYMSIYGATQSFIQSFTLALREEMRKFNINVSCLNPGPTSTDFFERAGLESLPVNSHEVKMSPKEVAQIAIEEMLHGNSEIIPGTNNYLGAYFSKLFPNKFVVKTVSGLFAPKH